MDRGGGHPRGPSNSRPYRGKLYCIRKPRARARRADPAGSIKDVASALYARGSRPTMDWPVLPAGVVTRSAASTLGTANPESENRERGCCGRAVSVEIRQTAGCSAFRAGPLLVAGPSAPGRAQTSLGGCRGHLRHWLRFLRSRQALRPPALALGLRVQQSFPRQGRELLGPLGWPPPLSMLLACCVACASWA